MNMKKQVEDFISEEKCIYIYHQVCIWLLIFCFLSFISLENMEN